MMRVYRDQADVATKMKRMLEMHVQPGQSLRDFVTHFMSYARRKTFAFQMDLYLNGRFCVNALYNGLPDHVRVALVKFRTEGTVEELAQAAIALDDEINGTRKKKEKKGRKGSSSSSSSDSEGDGRIGNVRRLEIVLETGEMNAVIVGAGTQTTTGKWSSRQWKRTIRVVSILGTYVQNQEHLMIWTNPCRWKL